jgi:hypothetical protein
MVTDEALVDYVKGRENIHTSRFIPEQTDRPALLIRVDQDGVPLQQGRSMTGFLTFELYVDSDPSRDNDSDRAGAIDERLQVLFKAFSTDQVEDADRIITKWEGMGEDAPFETDSVPLTVWRYPYTIQVFQA